MWQQLASNSTPAARRDTSGARFAAFIEYARDVFLQDASLKFQDYPEHPMFNEGFLAHHEAAFHRWRLHHTKSVREAKRLGDILVMNSHQVAETTSTGINNCLRAQEAKRIAASRNELWRAREERTKRYFDKRNACTLMVSMSSPCDCADCTASSQSLRVKEYTQCKKKCHIIHSPCGFELFIDRPILYYRLLLICNVIYFIIVPLNTGHCIFTFHFLSFNDCTSFIWWKGYNSVVSGL